MAASRPHKGPVVDTNLPVADPVDFVGSLGFVGGSDPGGIDTQSGHLKPRGRVRDGTWRPNHRFFSRAGIRIVMRRDHGVTKGPVLRVPLRFQAPVTDNFDRPYQYNWATYDTIRAGQKARPQGRQLLVLQLSTLLMDGVSAHASSGVVIWHGAHDPQKMIEELRWIMGDMPQSPEPEIFRLVISQPAVWGHHPLVNMLATLTAMQPEQRSEEMGTEYLSLTFQEYSERNEVARKQRPQSHGASRWKLDKGDTLYEIAKKSHFHRPSAWRLIAHANGIHGVSPNSKDELADWAKKHHKTYLRIPPKGQQEKVRNTDATRGG